MEAIYHYNEAIRLKPDYAYAYNNRGSTYARLGQYQLAIKDYNEALRLKPDYTLVYKNRGLSYIKQGNKELGCRDAQKACELGDCKMLEWAKGKGYCR
jgi:tetratricopeptide (TPR) repeat protein